jgi:coenzyme F420 biosynthesis associated uncharacterized protein
MPDFSRHFMTLVQTAYPVDSDVTSADVIDSLQDNGRSAREEPTVAQQQHPTPAQLGIAAALGMIGGMLVRTYVETRRRAPVAEGLIDWQQAEQAALSVSAWQSAPIANRQVRIEQYRRLVARSEPLIADYLGVTLPRPTDAVQVLDRREWIGANLNSFAALFAPVEQLLERGSLTAAVSGMNRRLLGTQIGLLLGYLSQRVLGQYDLSLLSAEQQSGTLYFVDCNIGAVQRRLNLNDEDFRLWITLHEMTHAFEFEAYGWVRPHFRALLERNFTLLADDGGGLFALVNRLVSGISSGRHWLEAVLTDEQRRLFDEIQALMAVVEGFGNHVMNAVGSRLLPSFHQIEQQIAERKLRRTTFDQIVAYLTGLDLKQAQYQLGEAFVDRIVAERGISGAVRIWAGPEYLPTMAEIRRPELWLQRIPAC